MSFHRPLYSPRVHGAIRTLEDRLNAVREASSKATVAGEVVFAASLRGKARGYAEAIDLLRAIERGTNLPKRLRWTDRRHRASP